jgi:hypothetical protein
MFRCYNLSDIFTICTSLLQNIKLCSFRKSPDNEFWDKFKFFNEPQLSSTAPIISESYCGNKPSPLKSSSYNETPFRQILFSWALKSLSDFKSKQLSLNFRR